MRQFRATARQNPTVAIKALGALTAIMLADWLFVDERAGWTIGAYTLAALAMAVVLNRRLGRRGAARAAVAAAVLGVVLLVSPSPLTFALSVAAAMLAGLLSELDQVPSAGQTANLFARFLVRSIFGPADDTTRWMLACNRRRSGRAWPWRDLIAPLTGTAIFLALFASANPVFENIITRFDIASLIGQLSFGRVSLWLLLPIPIWALLRPRKMRRLSIWHSVRSRPSWLTPTSVKVSLVAFNAVFAVENGLDLAFLWSGAPLPVGMTLAHYAHRGAYPLVLTAILAGMFVLFSLQPAMGAGWRVTRALVYLWTGQNIFLVASSVLRTADYIEAYGLTRLRLAALVWMGLVVTGLALIIVRIAFERSSAWLIDANMLAAAMVLLASTAVDYGGAVAAWNLRHADLMGGHVSLDEDYLRTLGASALVPLAHAQAVASPDVATRLASIRLEIEAAMRQRQADWHAWTPRDAWRLARADRLSAATEGRRP